MAILCVNLKVPGRTSEESHENPHVCSCLQMPPLGGSPSSWEEKSAGKIPGFGGRARLETELHGGGSDAWGRLQSSPGLVISFDFEQKITEEALGGEEG